ncbi:unnamed protein product, partial [Oikopleura dioica]
ELENGRLFRLISKMSMVQCQPPAGAVLGQEQSWSESGERRLVRLFRNYLFRQRTDQGNPFLSISHVISSLNKLDVGSDEKIILNSNDDRTVILATYNDIKSAINKPLACLFNNFSPWSAKPETASNIHLLFINPALFSNACL